MKSEIKYAVVYCSEIQLQRLTADKLPWFLSKFFSLSIIKEMTVIISVKPD